MAEYYGWTITGVVNELKSWSEPDFGSDTDMDEHTDGAVHIASRMVERQTFNIRQRNGREVEVNLVDSGLPVRNGHVLTGAWVARKGIRHGFCVLLDNHTTGAQARLAHNVRQIRPKTSLARTAKFGLIATVPALLVMLLWLLVPGSLQMASIAAILTVGITALIVLFIIGLIVSKLVLDYLQADDHQKIWDVADEGIRTVRSTLRRQAQGKSSG